MSLDLQLHFQLSAPPKAVMQLLTDDLLIRRWSGEDAQVGKAVGEAVSLFDGWAKGHITAYLPAQLGYTWRTTEWETEVPTTEVVFSLREKNGGTEVTLMHTGFDSAEERDNYKTGWNDFFFDPLEDYIMIFLNKE